jgi:hypothetical protein
MLADIPIAHLATFARVKKLSGDTSVIAEALKAEPTLVFNEAGDAVKRAEPLPADDNAFNLRCLRVVRSMRWYFYIFFV